MRSSREFAPIVAASEPGTLSFRVYHDRERPTTCCSSSISRAKRRTRRTPTRSAYDRLIAGRFADLIVEFVELDHELLVSL